MMNRYHTVHLFLYLQQCNKKTEKIPVTQMRQAKKVYKNILKTLKTLLLGCVINPLFISLVEQSNINTEISGDIALSSRNWCS